MNDDEAIKEAIERGSIEGHRVGTSSVGEQPANLSKAIKLTVLLLGDLEWHPAARIKRIAERCSTTYDTLSIEVGLAESKSGRWVCLGDEDVPLRAPDEK